MGERTPPKTDGFWISFRPISMRQEKAPQGIGHESTRAAADVVVTRDWRVYRFERLSNRALAAVGGKCRCGPLGRRFFILGEHSAAARGVGAAAGIEVQAIRCGTFLRRDCKRTKGIPKTMGLWRRFCILLPPWAKGCRAGARNIPAVGMKEKRCGPSRTPAPTGCENGATAGQTEGQTPAPTGCVRRGAPENKDRKRKNNFLMWTEKGKRRGARRGRGEGEVYICAETDVYKRQCNNDTIIFHFCK